VLAHLPVDFVALLAHARASGIALTEKQLFSFVERKRIAVGRKYGGR
jgi:hypothetical protein